MGNCRYSFIKHPKWYTYVHPYDCKLAYTVDCSKKKLYMHQNMADI